MDCLRKAWIHCLRRAIHGLSRIHDLRATYIWYRQVPGTTKCLRCARVRNLTRCSTACQGIPMHVVTASHLCRWPCPLIQDKVGVLQQLKLRRAASSQDHLGTPQPLTSSPTPLEWPSINTVLSTDILTLYHIPKSLRDRWARLLTTLSLL